MPVADYKTYYKMLDRARAGRFAFPAINVTSLTTANAVLRGLAESKSDGIIQISTGGGAFASGSSLKDMALGAIAIAEHVHRAAERYPIYVALHTDHCLKDKLDKFAPALKAELPCKFRFPSKKTFYGRTKTKEANRKVATKLAYLFVA